jgi:hypothetical protein
MTNTVFEIKILERKAIVFRKRYFVKTEAMSKWEKLPKQKRTKSLPEITLCQCNYDREGNILSTKEFKKNRLNTEKLSVENAKLFLNG